MAIKIDKYKEILIGKNLADETGVLGDITKLSYNKITGEYSFVIENGDATFNIPEEEIQILIDGGKTKEKFYIFDLEEISSTPDLSTLAQKREFLVGKELYSEGENLGKISKVLYSKIKEEYTIVIDEPLVLDEDIIEVKATESEIKRLSEKSGNIREYYIDELQEKEQEENISISKEALTFIASIKGSSEEEILNDLESMDYQTVRNFIASYPNDLEIRTAENGDILLDVQSKEIIPVETLKNSPDFKYYALTEDDKIVHGGEYKEDVREFISDRKSLVKLRLVAKRDLKPDADNNENWIEDSSEKIELKKRILLWIKRETLELSKEVDPIIYKGDLKQNNDIADRDWENVPDEFFKKLVVAYGDYILEKTGCAKKYLMAHTEKELRDEYKKLEMFY